MNGMVWKELIAFSFFLFHVHVAWFCFFRCLCSELLFVGNHIIIQNILVFVKPIGGTQQSVPSNKAKHKNTYSTAKSPQAADNAARAAWRVAWQAARSSPNTKVQFQQWLQT